MLVAVCRDPTPPQPTKRFVWEGDFLGGRKGGKGASSNGKYHNDSPIFLRVRCFPHGTGALSLRCSSSLGPRRMSLLFRMSFVPGDPCGNVQCLPQSRHVGLAGVDAYRGRVLPLFRMY